jgi:hypothetical protein
MEKFGLKGLVINSDTIHEAQLRGECKPVAYHSSHNASVYIYYLGSQQVTVDYSAFWRNG